MMLGLSISITLSLITTRVVTIFVIFILFAVRQAGFLFLSVSDSERQHIGIALCDVIRFYLLDGSESLHLGLLSQGVVKAV